MPWAHGGHDGKEQGGTFVCDVGPCVNTAVWGSALGQGVRCPLISGCPCLFAAFRPLVSPSDSHLPAVPALLLPSRAGPAVGFSWSWGRSVG